MGQILELFPAGASLKGCCGERGVRGSSAGNPGRLGGVEAARTGKKNHICPKRLCLRLPWAGEASYRKCWL